MSEDRRPRVLFVCVRNGGKSPMAAGLLERAADGAVDAWSAGTDPGVAVNALSAQVLAELGVDIAGHRPRPVTEDLLTDADRVVVLGQEARLDPVPGVAIERWETDEPSERGIDGVERMRLVRDDLDTRVRTLLLELVPDLDLPPSVLGTR